MRAVIWPLALGFGVTCMAWIHLPPRSNAEAALLHGNMEFSAAAKQKQKRATPPTTAYGPRPHFGGPADPSFGPDGKPYKVPEYLRNQCYIDEGYGRFSACSNRL